MSRGENGKTSRNNRRQDGQPESRIGTIEGITLKNFMCHSFLEVSFDKNVNFVVGKNGSGKSAILTGLIVGLGAKANCTSRATSVKGFIKSGESSATVEITLKNDGPGAHKPEIFGKSIIVHRTFTRSGGNTSKLKSASGKVISTKVKDILQVMNELNIQVDNPVCVLNQDTARNFLSSSDPKLKYDLFSRSTRLEILHNEYKCGIREKTSAEAVYKEKTELMEKLSGEIAEMQGQLEVYKNVLVLRSNLDKLETELLWSKVVDSEKELDLQRDVIEKISERHTELKGNSTGKETMYKKISEEVSEMKSQISELREAAQTNDVPCQELTNKLRSLRKHATNQESDRFVLQSKIQGLQTDLRTVQNHIDRAVSKMSQQEKDRVKVSNEIQQLEEKVKKLDSLMETYLSEIPLRNGDIYKHEEEMKTAMAQLDENRAKYNSTKEKINSLSRNLTDPLAAYGQDIVRLVQRIKASKNRFKQLPRGPLGSYISIKDKRWTLAVESVLGAGLLRSFYCDNKQDFDVLARMMEEIWTHGPKPSLLCGKFFHEVYDVSRTCVRAPRGCTSIYESLSVADPVVMNCLIDQASVETIMLVPTKDDGLALMSEACNVPPNCRMAVTTVGDQIYPDPDFRFYGGRTKHARYLQVDNTEVLRQYESSLATYAESKEQVQRNVESIRTTISAKKGELDQIRLKKQKCTDGSRAVMDKIAELKTSMQPQTNNVQDFEADKLRITQQIEQHQTKLAGIESESGTADEGMNQLKEQIAEYEKIKSDYGDRITQCEDAIKKLQQKRKQLETNNTFNEKRIAETEAELKTANDKLDRMQGVVNELAEQAAHVGERSEEIRPVEWIVTKIKQLQRSVKKVDNQTESPESLLERYHEKMAIQNRVAEMMECICQTLTDLGNAYRQRKRHYKSTRDYFESYVKHCFQRFLLTRQFQGSLDINFEDKTLDMTVMPQQGSQGVTPTTNLSGGERSFSTVAFLYSLWQCLDFPFYFMDEFDVYMDKVNRTAVMEILIYHAKTHPHQQYVFLTPQDVSFIKDQDVALHRLEDPERAAIP